MDVISDALRVIRLKGSLFLNAEFREPWCVTAPKCSDLWTMLPPPHRPLALVETLRGYIEALPEQRTGWISGLRDPLVGKSIALMHEKPAEPWTIASLAKEVGASRTVLADRFVAMVGIPPIQYLTQWRIALAAHLLRGDQLTLAQIAEQVGYESEAAFSRAFKREYGKPPATWRRLGESAA